MTQAELDAVLESLPHWEVEAGHLVRRMEFESFVEVLDYMRRCAPAIEALDHHPDWSNVYTHLTIRLQTHEASALTNLDAQLARELEALYASR